MSDRQLAAVSHPEQRSALEAFRKKLGQEAHNLRREWVAEYPAFIFQQMHNRLQWDDTCACLGLSPSSDDRTTSSQALASPWIRLLDRPRESVAAGATFLGHAYHVWSCAYSHDGTRIVSGGDEGDVRIWDAARGTPLLHLDGREGDVLSCLFTGDDRQVVCGGWHTLHAWDAATGAEVYAREYAARISCCALTRDGRTIAVATDDGLVHVSAASDGAVLATLEHGRMLHTCAFSPDGARLLSGGGQTLKVWDWARDLETASFTDEQDPIFGCGFSVDGERVIWVGGGSIHIRDIEEGGETTTIPAMPETSYGALEQFALSSDGTMLVCGGDSVVRIFDIRDGRQLAAHHGHTDFVYAVAFSPDDRTVVSASFDATLRTWDASVRTTDTQTSGHRGPIRAVVYSNDGTRILTCGEDETARVWDASHLNELLTVDTGAAVSCGGFSPDARLFVAAGDQEIAGVWEVVGGEHVCYLGLHGGPVNACTFSPDGRHICTACSDAQLRMWSLDRPDAPLWIGEHDRSVLSCAHSPDGRHVVSGSLDGVLRVWDARTGDAVRGWPAHAADIRFCAFSPDSKWVVSGGDDGEIYIWDVVTGERTASLHGHGSSARTGALSADGRLFASAGDDATLRLWDVPSRAQIALLALSPMRAAALSPTLGCGCCGTELGDLIRFKPLWPADGVVSGGGVPGGAVSDGDVSDSAASEDRPDRTRITCPHCGGTVDPAAPWCPDCGRDLGRSP